MSLSKTLRIAMLGLMLVSAVADATTVMVMSLARGRAQIVVNGSAVRQLTEGQTSPEGVTLISATPAQAVLVVDGKTMTFRTGDATSSEVVIPMDRSGSFPTAVQVNGVTLRGIIDTGATSVALNMTDARAAGVDFSQAKSVITHTANGSVRAYTVTLRSVRVGDIDIANVPALVMEGGATQLGQVLVGMSFLRQVQWRSVGNALELRKGHH